jgi:hypothetical protein
MRWQDIDSDGAWNILSDKGEKGNAGILVLPELALKVLSERPRFTDNPHVFDARGKTHFSDYSNAKRRFESRLSDGFAQWQLHDLCRTARSLMSRGGLRPDIAERVMGVQQASSLFFSIRGVNGKT